MPCFGIGRSFQAVFVQQAGNLTLDLGDLRTARSIVTIAVPVANRRRLTSALVSRRVVDCRFHTLAGPSTR